MSRIVRLSSPRSIHASLALAVALLVGACSTGRDAAPGQSTGRGAADARRDAPAASSDATSGRSNAAARAGATPVVIATGGMRETDYQIGRDLATFVAPDAGITLEVAATKGSADNLHRLNDEHPADLAIVQYDVIQAFLDEAGAGNAAAAKIVKSLRIVTPLYTEELYVVVRSDAPMKSIDDIRGRRINLGVRGSGSALTAANLYRRMFQAPIAAQNARYLTDEQALAALTVDKTLDVVVIVAAQPAKLFADMKTEARGYIRLLPLDPTSAGSREALKTYFSATIRARNYGWLARDVPTLSVMSFLVTSGRPGALTPHMAGFATSLCTHLPTLRVDGHPKWREVQLGRQYVPQWNYDAASAAAFGRCAAA